MNNSMDGYPVVYRTSVFDRDLWICIARGSSLVLEFPRTSLYTRNREKRIMNDDKSAYLQWPWFKKWILNRSL